VALAYDGSGILYVADQLNHTIRQVVLATATVTTLAGSAGEVGARDGIGEDARFDLPAALALDGAGYLFVADKAAHTIRKIVLATRNVTTLAGTAGIADHSDGVGTAAAFNTPAGLACDGAGNLFVADTGNGTIRKIVIATATTTTVAGTAGNLGYGDGTGAGAQFLTPTALTSDGAGHLLIADTEANTVRRLDVSTGTVTTVVGHPARWETVPGPLPAYVASPSGLAVLPSGAIAISDAYENAVLIAMF
jgi:sugar lactone lactonase YvrE